MLLDDWLLRRQRRRRRAETEVARDGCLLVHSQMGVEVLRRLIRAQHKDPAFQVLLLEVFDLFVHDDLLAEVVQLFQTFALDFGVDLDEHLEVPGHHVR